MQCRDTQDEQVMMESSDKTWSAGEGNGKPLQHSCLENPMNSMKRQNERILTEVQPRCIQGDSKVGTESASLEITYLITDREGLEN